MNLLRYQWKLVVFSLTLKSCLQSPLSVVPALPSDNIAGQSHSISHHISLGWIIKTHSQLWKSPVLSNLKLPSHMEGRPPPTMPPNLLCEREGGGLFLSSSDSSRVGVGGQRGRVSRGKATGVFLTSWCSLKALPSYQCPVLWSSSIRWGKGVRWWVWGETLWISVHTGWRAVLSSWPPTAHRSCFSAEDSPCGSGLMLEGSDQLSECLMLRFYS